MKELVKYLRCTGYSEYVSKKAAERLESEAVERIMGKFGFEHEREAKRYLSALMPMTKADVADKESELVELCERLAIIESQIAACEETSF